MDIDPRQLLSSYNFTPDVIIIFLVAGLMLYGLLLGRHKLKTLALSSYVGWVLAAELSDVLKQFVPQLDGTPARLLLFGLPLILLEIGRREHRRSQAGGVVMTMILAALTSALIIAGGINSLSADTRAALLDESTLATGFYGLRLWWIGLVPLAVVGENFIRSKE